MNFEPGDLLLFYGRDWISRGIEIFTRGPSHVGIVTNVYQRGLLLFESTTLCDLPDEISGERRPGAQFHDPHRRIAAYPGDVFVARLSDGWKLDQHEIDWLAGWCWHRRKAGYSFEGAALAGPGLLKWTNLLPYPDNRSVFCSQLCAAALMRLNRLALEHPGVYSPATLIRRLNRCGVYGRPKSVKSLSQKVAA